MNKSTYLLFIAIFMSTESIASPITVDQALKLPEAEVEANLADSHPSVLYAYAARRFGAEQKDEAVVWFYAGQLRYRYHIVANPDLPQDGEPALLASLNSTVGRAINEWAGGSPKVWAAAIDKALIWDSENPNPTTPKDSNAKALEETRAGLTELRDHIVKNEEQIRSQRQSLGLEVR